MGFRGVHDIELSVLDCEASSRSYHPMFGWLGHRSFRTPDAGYRSTCHKTRFPLPNRVPVTEAPAACPTDAPGHDTVLCEDPTGIRREPAHGPRIPMPWHVPQTLPGARALGMQHPAREMVGKLPSRHATGQRP